MEYFKRLKELSEKGNNKAALKIASQWVLAEPENPKAWYNYGTLLNFTSNNIAAEKALRKCIDLDSKHVHGLANLGSVLCCSSNFDQAIDFFKKALKYSDKEDYGSILAKLSDCYLNIYKYDSAAPLIGELYKYDQETALMLEGKMIRDATSGKRRPWWKRLFN